MSEVYLVHHGIKGQKWGVRRYQNPDGTLTSAGRRRRNALDQAADSADKFAKLYRESSQKNKKLSETFSAKDFGKKEDYDPEYYDYLTSPKIIAEAKKFYGNLAEENADSASRYENLSKQIKQTKIEEIDRKQLKDMEKWIKKCNRR